MFDNITTNTDSPNFTAIESCAMIILAIAALTTMGWCLVELSQQQHDVVGPAEPPSVEILPAPTNCPFPI
jgi:hypothetical protein